MALGFVQGHFKFIQFGDGRVKEFFFYPTTLRVIYIESKLNSLETKDHETLTSLCVLSP